MESNSGTLALDLSPEVNLQFRPFVVQLMPKSSVSKRLYSIILSDRPLNTIEGRSSKVSVDYFVRHFSLR